MRIRNFLILPILGAMIAAPARAPAQITIRFGARLGPEVGVYAYSQERQGDWQRSYRQWTPVTLYDVNGHYYRNNVQGARPVAMYTYRNEYFLPPQDQAWVNKDRRYNYGRRPNQDDYGRNRPYTPQPVVDRRLGLEIGVLQYSPDRAGDWRTNARRWTPVTVYESNGRYYPNNVPGTRAVSMYRFQNEYFLPPRDQEWVNSDRRFNYKNQPTADDHGRARSRP